MISFSSFVEYMVGNCLLFHLPPPLTSIERAVVVSADQYWIRYNFLIMPPMNCSRSCSGGARYTQHGGQSVHIWRCLWYAEGTTQKLPDFCSVFWPSGDRWGKGVSMVSLASCFPGKLQHIVTLNPVGSWTRFMHLYPPWMLYHTNERLVELPSLVNMSSASNSNILFARWVFSRCIHENANRSPLISMFRSSGLEIEEGLLEGNLALYVCCSPLQHSCS